MGARRGNGRRGATVLALGGLLLTAACGGSGSGPATASATPAQSPPPSAVVALGAGNFDAAVGQGVSLVEFFHPACSHCQAMEPVVEQLAADFAGRAVVGQVNVTTEPLLTQRWGVRAYPTFVALKDGQESGRWLGETSYARLAGMIRIALGASRGRDLSSGR